MPYQYSKINEKSKNLLQKSQSMRCLPILKIKITLFSDQVGISFIINSRFLKVQVAHGIHSQQFQSMCLFFGNLVQECDHAQCQIVQTIKALNQQSLFHQVMTHQSNIEREGLIRNQGIPSISNLIEQQRDEACFKVEEQDPPSMEYNCPGQPTYQEENYKERVDKLERELKQLRSLTHWMKSELEKKGILS